MHKLLVQCPVCGTETKLWLVEPTYEGPFRCWKCKEAFMVTIDGKRLKSSQPMSEEELEQYCEE
jgi:hypothetical protein